MKRTISFISLALSLLVVLSIFAVAVTVSRGITVNAATSVYDMNGDGSLNINDVLAALKAVNNPNAVLEQDGDVNNDGEFNIVDVLVLLKRITEATTDTPTYTNLLKVSEEHASLVQDGAWAGACAGASGGVNANICAYISDSTLTIDTAEPLYGAKALKIVSSASSVNPQFVLFQNFADLGIERGKTYTFFAKVRGEGFDATALSNYTALEMQYCDEDANAKTSSVRDALTNKSGDAPTWRGATLDGDKFGWTTIKMTFTVPTDDASLTVNKNGTDYDCETLRFVLRGYKGEGTTVYFDALGLVEGSYTHDELSSTVIPALLGEPNAQPTPEPTAVPTPSCTNLLKISEEHASLVENGSWAGACAGASGGVNANMAAWLADASLTIDSVDPLYGNKTLKIVSAETSANPQFVLFQNFADLGIERGKTYTFFAKVRGEGFDQSALDSYFSLEMQYCDEDANVKSASITDILTSKTSDSPVLRGATLDEGKFDWTTIKITFTVPTDDASLSGEKNGDTYDFETLRMVLHGRRRGVSTVYFDALGLVEGSYTHDELSSEIIPALFDSVATPTPTITPGDDDEMFPYFNGTNEQTISLSSSCKEYTYSDTSADDFTAYKALLLEKGYTLVSENSIKDNLFAGFEKDGKLLYAYYTKYDNLTRIIDDPVSPTSKLTSDSYEKITETKIAAIAHAYSPVMVNRGMCFVITLEDGRYIVIDSGGNDVTDEGSELFHTRLRRYLNDFNEHPSGKIHIAAWIATHDHYDHTEAMVNYLLTYYEDTTVEYIIANTPSGGRLLPTALGDICELYPDTQVIVPHSGQNFEFCNTKFEILYTQEDFFPAYTPNSSSLNDCSMNFRLYANGQTILFPGDTQQTGATIVCNMYGDYLKSDMVQAAHHGNSDHTATKEYYGFVDPETVLWPFALWSVEGWRYGVSNAYLLSKLNVKEIIVSDITTKILTLPYTPGNNEAVEYVVTADEVYPFETDTTILDPRDMYWFKDWVPSEVPSEISNLIITDDETATNIVEAAWPGAVSSASGGFEKNVGSWSSPAGATFSFDETAPHSGSKSFKIVSTAATANPQIVLFQNFADLGLERGKTYTFFARVRGENITQNQFANSAAIGIQFTDEFYHATCDTVCLETRLTLDYPSKRGAVLNGDNFDWTTVKITFDIPTEDEHLTVYDGDRECIAETLRIVLYGFGGNEGSATYFDCLGIVEGAYSHETVALTIMPSLFDDVVITPTPVATPTPAPVQPSTPTLLKISEEHASLVQDGAWAGACAGASGGVNANIGAWRSESTLTIDTASPLYGDKTLKIVASDASVNPQFVLFQNFADLGIERGKTYTFFAKVRGEGFDSTELSSFTALEMQYCDEDVNAKTDLVTDILTNKTSDAPTRRGATLDGDKFSWTTIKITFTVPTDDAELTVNKNGSDYDCETLRLVLRGYKGEGTTVYFDCIGLVEGSYTHDELNSTVIPQFFGEPNK